MTAAYRDGAIGTPAEGIFIARPTRSPLGIPLAVKDLFDTAGLTTTYGSAIFADHVPAETAEAVVRCEAAGYANVGKTNLHEFAYGVTSENPHFGSVKNPRSPRHIAGGSSGGSAAAIAAGFAVAALGTDSGGSIRIPAACCGVVGLKPTHGLVPISGCWPLAPSFDCAGPMASDVATCVRLIEALVPGFKPQPLESLEELTIGVGWLGGAEAFVRARVEEAVALFPRRRLIEPPLPDTTVPLFMREIADVHRDLYADNAAQYGPDVATKIERCLAVDDATVTLALRARDAYREEFEALLDTCDLFVTPTVEMLPPLLGIGDAALRDRLIKLTYPINVLGAPALALPCGAATKGGLNASLQLIGRPGADALVLAAGLLLEQAMNRPLQTLS